jgi:hypothetical protein
VAQQESVVRGGQLAVTVVSNPVHSGSLHISVVKAQLPEGGAPVTVVTYVGQLRVESVVIVRVIVVA